MTEHEPPSQLTPRIGRVARRELALHGYTRYAQLAEVAAADLLRIHGIGPKAIRILQEELAARGSAFAGTALGTSIPDRMRLGSPRAAKGTSGPSIGPAYSSWTRYNGAIRDVVGGLTDEQLAMRPSPERWPIWATVGHAACQRVFWLCDFAGEPGADTTPFTNAAYNCPGDDDLEHVLGADALVAALDSTFRIVEGCLDRWTLDMLDEEIRRPEWDGTWVHTRGAVIQRVFAHDVYHCAELNEALGAAGLTQIDLWQ